MNYAQGVIYIYRGILPNLLKLSTTNSIMFGTYSQYQRLITDYYCSKNQVIIVEKFENGETRTIQMSFKVLSLLEACFDLTFLTLYENSDHVWENY